MVERFRLIDSGWDYSFFEDKDGQYVAFKDYQALESKLDAIRRWHADHDEAMFRDVWAELDALLNGLVERRATNFKLKNLDGGDVGVPFLTRDDIEAAADPCGHQHDMGFTCILRRGHSGYHEGAVVWDGDGLSGVFPNESV